MHDNHHETSPESLRRRHEQQDISAKGIVTFLAFLTLATGFAAFLMVLLFWYFQEQEAKNDAPPSPLALGVKVTPEPRLQALPAIDLAEMRKRDAAMLTTYCWVRKEAQVVRVPIEKGMQMLLKRGLPAFPIIPQATAAAGTAAPGTAAAAPAPQPAAPEVVPTPAAPAPQPAAPEVVPAPADSVPPTPPVATPVETAPIAETPAQTPAPEGAQAPVAPDASAGAAQ